MPRSSTPTVEADLPENPWVNAPEGVTPLHLSDSDYPALPGSSAPVTRASKRSAVLLTKSKATVSQPAGATSIISDVPLAVAASPLRETSEQFLEDIPELRSLGTENITQEAHHLVRQFMDAPRVQEQDALGMFRYPSRRKTAPRTSNFSIPPVPTSNRYSLLPVYKESDVNKVSFYYKIIAI